MYDPLGNREMEGSSGFNNVIGIGNRLEEDARAQYIYDAEGNLTQRFDKGSGSVENFTWDGENRLRSYSRSGGPSAPISAFYEYDVLGRRASKTVDGVSTWYAYNGEDIVAEFNNSGALAAVWDHGPGIDEPIQMIRDGNQFVYSRDGLGSISQQYAYSSFGETRILDASGNDVTSNPPVQSPYGFTGREFDSESGLYYYRARVYDPGTGRFLSQETRSDHSTLTPLVVKTTKSSKTTS